MFGAFVLASAWFFYLLSVICGIWVLMALTGTLAPLEPSSDLLTLGENIRRPSGYQIILFLIATVLIIVYGIHYFVIDLELLTMPEIPNYPCQKA